LAVTRNYLAFLNHVHELNIRQGDPSRTKGFEPEHRPDYPFDRSMILPNQIIQVLDLASWPVSYLSASMAAVLAPLLSAMGGEQKIDDLVVLVDDTV